MAKLTLAQLVHVLEDMDFVAIPRLSADGKPAVTIAATGSDEKRCFLNRSIVGRDEETAKAQFGWTVGDEMVRRSNGKA